jgi:hypothetical protein
MGDAGGCEGLGGGPSPAMTETVGLSRMAGTANSHSPNDRNTAKLAKSG